MRRSQPDFWQRDGLLSALLAPLGWAFGTAAAVRRVTERPWRASVPVICVGNLVVGGAGKTPVAIDLAERLAAGGERPHLLTRGYGGALAGPVRVDPSRHGFRDVGDEALLLARAGPAWVARQRAAGARAAIADGASILILDDGFQNPSLVQDLKLVVIDGETGFGNGRVMPAGPLREPIAIGLARADAVVVMGENQARLPSLPGGMMLLRAKLMPRPDAPDLRGAEIIAFAGIGRPAKFFRFLEGLGARLVASHAFLDHQPYDEAMLAPLLAEATRHGVSVITTEKDLVRVPPTLRGAITALPVTVKWDDAAALEVLLARAIAGKVDHG